MDLLFSGVFKSIKLAWRLWWNIGKKELMKFILDIVSLFDVSIGLVLSYVSILFLMVLIML